MAKSSTILIMFALATVALAQTGTSASTSVNTTPTSTGATNAAGMKCPLDCTACTLTFTCTSCRTGFVISKGACVAQATQKQVPTWAIIVGAAAIFIFGGLCIYCCCCGKNESSQYAELERNAAQPSNNYNQGVNYAPPTYNQGTTQPGYNPQLQPAYGQPAYGQPAYGAPGYTTYGNNQPAYGNNQPAYGNRAYSKNQDYEDDFYNDRD